jgi:hypothetical protein
VIELCPPALVVFFLGIFHYVLTSSFVKRNPNYKCCYPTKEPGIVATHKDFKSAHHIPTITSLLALSVIPARTTSAPPRYNEQEPKKKGIKPCTRCGQAHGASKMRRHCEDGVYSLMWGEIPVGDPLTKINGLFVKSQVFI